MFARWLFVRLSAAEKALGEGRIDDVVTALAQPDLCGHPRGQRLLDGLVRPLVARARLHRQAGRYRAALADLDLLLAWGRAGPEVQTLRQQITEEMRQAARREADRQEAVGRAADMLRAGRLETMRLDLDRVSDDKQRAQLAQELERRVERSSQLLEQAAAVLDRDDVLAAVRLWQDACRQHGRTRESEAFAGRLAASCRRLLESWFQEGRVDRLLGARAGLESLLAVDPALAEWARVSELCARAVGQFAAADYSTLRQTLLRLKGAGREVTWINQALEALSSIAQAEERLMASPLGLCASMPAGPAAGTLVQAVPSAGRSAVGPPPDPDALRLERPLLVLVDGGGSALLVPGERVRVGRVGSSMDVEVPLPGEVQSHQADIIRRGEDYFLTAYGHAEVNQRRVEHALLRDGDRLVFGRQVKMVFCRPSAKSGSAVLRLSHRSRLPQDVSAVVLFHDTCLIGPGAACHVRTREGDGQVVLFGRGGALHARQLAGPGWAAAPPRAVVAGRTLEFGDLRVTVKPYAVRC